MTELIICLDTGIHLSAKIIQALSQALSRANLSAKVDNATGDITLESTVFFESNSSTIKDEGRELLARFLPVYLDVLEVVDAERVKAMSTNELAEEARRLIQQRLDETEKGEA